MNPPRRTLAFVAPNKLRCYGCGEVSYIKSSCPKADLKEIDIRDDFNREYKEEQDLDAAKENEVKDPGNDDI